MVCWICFDNVPVMFRPGFGVVPVRLWGVPVVFHKVEKVKLPIQTKPGRQVAADVVNSPVKSRIELPQPFPSYSTFRRKSNTSDFGETL